jgi:molybdopterin converting factor small subunit
LLPNAFQKHTNGTREIRSEAGNLPQLIAEMETQFPALKTHLRDEQGQVRRFINFYVNEEDIRFLGNEKYAFQDGDEVLVIPSIAGGSWPGAARTADRASRKSGTGGCALRGRIVAAVRIAGMKSAAAIRAHESWF